jgi:molybdopterin/thiamine biosynthesis adenylyltransferase
MVDFDTLEISNLNRQFLYRDGDRRKPKVQIAKKRIKLVNPDINIEGYKLKVELDSYSDTINIQFWDSLDLCINALDNISGRVYLDVKCIENEIPFYETGTEGQMAHTSVILPFKTNTYTDYKIIEPKEQRTETIPFCTLRNEPHSIHHCTEWAISKFDDHFVSGFRDIRIFLDTTLSQYDLTIGQITSLVQALQWLYDNELNITLEACLRQVSIFTFLTNFVI